MPISDERLRAAVPGMSKGTLRILPICCSIADVRRLFLSLLLVLAGLPAVAPILVLGQVSRGALTVPACCRRNGAHHCLMSPDERAASGVDETTSPVEVQVRAPAERCPFPARNLVKTHLEIFASLSGAGTATPVHDHASGTCERAYRLWMMRDRTWPKRGPPTALLS